MADQVMGQRPLRFYADDPDGGEVLTPVEADGRARQTDNGASRKGLLSSLLGDSPFFKKEDGSDPLSFLHNDLSSLIKLDRIQKDDLILLGIIFLLLYDE